MAVSAQQSYSTSFRLPDETLGQLRELSEQTGLSQALILRLMIAQAHRKYGDGDGQILDLLGIG